MERNRVFVGSALDFAERLPRGSVHCIVTSPPYYGLRSYLPDGHPDKCHELGCERTPEEYVANLVAVFRALREALHPSGTCWVNLGDSYNSASNFNHDRKGSGLTGGVPYAEGDRGGRALLPGLGPKQLLMIPARFALAMQADGWILRADIIWHKPNPMPESVTDRPTKAHEYLFLLSKRANYFYDAEAVREPHATAATDPRRRVTPEEYEAAKVGRYVRKGEDELVKGRMVEKKEGYQYLGNPAGRNKRSVWTVATAPYPGAHYATFPPELIRPCIRAGTSARGCCPRCGAPWVRVVEREPMVIARSERGAAMGEFGRTQASGTMVEPASAVTLGWQPSCRCPAHEPVPAVVADPFCGSGTTCQVATEEGRDWYAGDLDPRSVGWTAERLARTQVRLPGWAETAG